jgi:hypothetical protein
MFEGAILIVDSTINQKDVAQEGDNFGHISYIQTHDELKDQTNYNSSFVMLKSKCFDSNWYLHSRAYGHVTGLVENISKVERNDFLIKSVGRQCHLVAKKSNVMFNHDSRIKQVEDVLLVSGVTKNLLLVSSITYKGC